jgi:hypothetical protein
MENLSFIEIILVFVASNTLSFLFAYYLQILKTEALNKKITKLEQELMKSDGEIIREFKENVRLEGIIKNLLNANPKNKQLLN